MHYNSSNCVIIWSDLNVVILFPVQHVHSIALVTQIMYHNDVCVTLLIVAAEIYARKILIHSLGC